MLFLPIAIGLPAILHPEQLRPPAPAPVTASIDRNIMKSYKTDKEKREIKEQAEQIKKVKSPFESQAGWNSRNFIDTIVENFINSQKLKPAKLCSDAVFLRRAYLDLTGTLPTVDATVAFIYDKSPGKREKLVDSLIASDDFVKYWTMRFGDILKIKAEFPVNLWPNAAQAYTRFVEKSIADNTSWAEIVRRMLTSSGSNFRVGEVNFFRAMQGRGSDKIAASIIQTFMNTRIDSFPPEKAADIAKFFDRLSYKETREWKEEIVFSDPSKAAPFEGKLPDGDTVSLSPDTDPRTAFALWLTAKNNPYFAKSLVNRVWTWMFGTPLAYPVDDMFAKGAKTPCPELLEKLAEDFAESNFDLRRLCRQIALSRTYQQSSIPSDEVNPRVAMKNFAVYGMRQMDAEMLIDALCKVSGTSEIYSSTTPEPYTTMPDFARALDIPDGSITSSFLELFGKSPRDTGAADERNANPSPLQKLHMINSSHIRNKIISGPTFKKYYNLKGDNMAHAIYLDILSRYPTEDEKSEFENYIKTSKLDRKSAGQDLAWALINSDEFIFRH